MTRWHYQCTATDQSKLLVAAFIGFRICLTKIHPPKCDLRKDLALQGWSSIENPCAFPCNQNTTCIFHSFGSENVSLVHQESTWFKRGVAKSIHIMLKEPSLNRDCGQHTLPAIYLEVLQQQSHDTSSTSGSCDQHPCFSWRRWPDGCWKLVCFPSITVSTG